MKPFTPVFQQLLSMSVVLCALTGCHFGDPNAGLDKLSTQRRSLSYSANLALSGSLETNDSIVDLGPEGLKVNFGQKADIAVMGEEFCKENDTLGVSQWPYPVVLSYREYNDFSPKYEGDRSIISFDYNSYGRHGVGEDYATQISYLYPASKAVDRDGKRLKARAESIPMDFVDQDGRLLTLRRRYFTALGTASALCSKNKVVMRDSAQCQAGHDHASSASQMVLLDLKLAIVRLSLVVPAQEDYPLLQYLQSQRMSGNNLYVDQIELINRHPEPAGISKTNLNLNTGWVEPDAMSLSFLILKDQQQFKNHDQIMRESPQSLAKVGGGSTWGTLVYVAFPCTQEGCLDLDLDVVVHIGKVGESADKSFCLYGSVHSIELHEGHYYVSSPVLLYREKENHEHSAQFYLIP